MKSFAIFYFILFFSIFSHDERYDGLRRQSSPEAIFTREKFQDLQTSTREGDLGEKIQKHEKILEEYYSQFIEEKRIEADRERAGEFTDKLRNSEIHLFFRTHAGKLSPSSNVNAVRLFAAEKNSLFSPTRMIRDSESLYKTHTNLGKLYRGNGQKHKAVEHFLAGFRYRNLSPTEENFERPQGFREMLNDAHKEKLKTHLEKKKELEELQKQVQEDEDEIHLLEAETLRNNLASRTSVNFDSTAHKQRVLNQKENLKAKIEEYNRSKNENFLPVIKARGEEDASTLLELADLIKELESDTKEQISGSRPYPSEKTRQNNFPGYVSILEFAHKLAPEHPEVIRLIAEEYKTSNKKREALGFFMKYDNLPKEVFSEPESQKDVSLSIASLYSDLGNNVSAIPYYERHFESLEEKEKIDFSFFLGEFYLKRIGNINQSGKYFQIYLYSLKDTPSDPENLRKQCIAHLGLFKYWDNLRQPTKSRESIEKSYKAMKDISEILNSKTDEITEKKFQLTKQKNALLYNTTEEELNAYREAEQKLMLEIQKRDEVKNLYFNLPKYEILIQFTKISEQDRDYKKAKLYLREIMDFGTEVEINRALKNILRIEKTEKDGYLRPWIE